MIKDSYVWVKIRTNNYNYIIKKIWKSGISIYDINYKNNSIVIKIKIKDYVKLKKCVNNYKNEIYSYTGIERAKRIINNNFIFIISIAVSIIILLFMNNISIKVEVHSTNNKIVDIINKELEKHNLGVMKLKKNHQKIEKIIDRILKDNKDTLEWLEIKYDGLKLIVELTEKSKIKNNKEEDHCDIVAKKDAKISSMNVYKGTIIKEINDYVLKGETIISGDIVHNEEVKDIVCSKGKIYGEVWYKVNITIPLKETYKEYTGKNRLNMSTSINGKEKLLFKSRVKNNIKKRYLIYKLKNFKINIVKEKEYINKEKSLTKEEAYQKGIKLGIEKIKMKLKENEEVLVQKVLKKETFDSTIYIELFVATKENIGDVKIIREDKTYDNGFVN